MTTQMLQDDARLLEYLVVKWPELDWATVRHGGDETTDAVSITVAAGDESDTIRMAWTEDRGKWLLAGQSLVNRLARLAF